jgi:hypothetical protein
MELASDLKFCTQVIGQDLDLNQKKYINLENYFRSVMSKNLL